MAQRHRKGQAHFKVGSGGGGQVASEAADVLEPHPVTHTALSFFLTAWYHFSLGYELPLPTVLCVPNSKKKQVDFIRQGKDMTHFISLATSGGRKCPVTAE